MPFDPAMEASEQSNKGTRTMTHKEQRLINGALIDLSTVEKVLAYSEAWA